MSTGGRPGRRDGGAERNGGGVEIVDPERHVGVAQVRPARALGHPDQRQQLDHGGADRPAAMRPCCAAPPVTKSRPAPLSSTSRQRPCPAPRCRTPVRLDIGDADAEWESSAWQGDAVGSSLLLCDVGRTDLMAPPKRGDPHLTPLRRLIVTRGPSGQSRVNPTGLPSIRRTRAAHPPLDDGPRPGQRLHLGVDSASPPRPAPGWRAAGRLIGESSWISSSGTRRICQADHLEPGEHGIVVAALRRPAAPVPKPARSARRSQRPWRRPRPARHHSDRQAPPRADLQPSSLPGK